MTSILARRTIFGLSLAIGLAWGCGAASAVEPAREFLEALRREKMFDVAIDYLGRIADSPLVLPEVKEAIPFERGLILVEWSRVQIDPATREKYLDDAQKSFADFIAQHASHPLAAEARTQLGSVLVERARVKIYKAERSNNATEKTKLQGEAVVHFDEASKVFTAAQEDLKAKLGMVPPDATDAKLIADRDLWRSQSMTALMVTAQIAYEKGMSFKDIDKVQFEKFLTEAAGKFKDIADKYRRFISGMYAKMNEGRCFQDLGGDKNNKEALTIYSELLANDPNSADLRDLRTKVLRNASEVWLRMKNYEEVVRQGETWLKDAQPGKAEILKEEWIELRMLLGEAYVLHYESMKPEDRSRGNVRALALKHFKHLTQVKGEHTKKAQAFTLRLGSGTPEVAGAKKPDPKTFKEAQEAGYEALQALSTEQSNVGLLASKIPGADEEAKKDLTAKLEEAKKKIPELQNDVMRNYTAAIRLAGPEVPDDELNSIRYFLCWLNYNLGDFENAAVYGTFVATHYPNGPTGKTCAELALRAYQMLHYKAPKDERAYESAQLTKLCRLITAKWPNEEMAVNAFAVMTDLLVAEGKLEEAQANLEKIPANSAKRGGAELRTGQAMWRTFRKGQYEVALIDAGSEDAPKLSPDEVKALRAKLDPLKTAARKTLEDGIARMQKAEKPPGDMPNAMLFLTQIYVESAEPDKAIALLEDPKFGALTLIEKNDDLVNDPNFERSAFKAALRAYIASLPKSKNAKTTLTKAEAVMKKLVASFGKSEKDRAQLVKLFVELAQELKELIDLSPESERAPLISGFETFLKQAGENSKELNVRNWIAETFRGMGEALNNKKDAAQAKRYFTRAAEAYRDILKTAAEDKAYLTAELDTQIRLQLARTLVKIGDSPSYIEAIGEYAKILEVKKSALNIQVEAARAYQLRARVEGPRWYTFAMAGGRKPTGPDGKPLDTEKNIIWGWSQLGKTTQKYAYGEDAEKFPIFKSTFYEAWLRYAESAYELGTHASTNAADRASYLASAKNNITRMAQLYPEMGGPERRAEYDELLKKVQAALKEKVTGLPEPVKKPAASPKPAPATTTTSAPK